MRIADRKESPIIGLSGMGGGFASYILYGGSGSSVYEISRSLRFDSTDSGAYLDRTSSAGNRRTWTWSGWIKRSAFASQQALFTSTDGATATTAIYFSSTDELVFYNDRTGVTTVETDSVLRDPSAWYHAVIAVDTTQATPSDRVKIYLNGVQQTLSGTYPTEDFDTEINRSSFSHKIGGLNSSTWLFYGYLADVHFIDGQALAATDFGETDEYGIWNPKRYTGTHGTNGFHLKFDDNSSASALGTDAAGSNDWTVNNLTAVVRSVVGATVPYQGRGTSDAYILFDSTAAPLSGSTFPIDSSYLGHAGISSPFDSEVITFSPAITSAGNVYLYACRQSSGGNIKVNVGYPSETTISIDGSWDYYDTGLSTIYNIQFLAATSSSNILTGLQFISTTSDASGRVSSSPPQHQDSLIDTPTNYTADSNNNGGNYCTWSPLVVSDYTPSSSQLVNGNLEGNANRWYFGTQAFNTDKWYWELSGVTNSGIGIYDINAPKAAGDRTSHSVVLFADPAFQGVGTKPTAFTYSNTDVIGLALDADANTLAYYKNGTLQGTVTNLTADKAWTPFMAWNSSASTAAHVANFGQRPFAYTPPAGYLSLCTQNLPTPAIEKPSEQIGIVTYTGNGTSQAVSGLSFSPDLVWIKDRDIAWAHQLFDKIRGVYNVLNSSSTNGESTNTEYLTAFNSDGFTVGSNSVVNNGSNPDGYVAWTWNAGSNSNRTYNVTVVDDGGNKYRFNGHGTSAVTLELEEGSTYVFDSSDSSVDSHPFVLGTSANSDAYSTGVTYTLDGTNVTYSAYTSGFASATTRKLTITVPVGAPTLYYWCSVHSGMGGQINTNETAGSSVLSNSLNSSVYNQDQDYYATGTQSGSWAGSYDWEGVFISDDVASFTEAESLAATGATKFVFGTPISASTSVTIIGYIQSSGTFRINEGETDETSVSISNSGSVEETTITFNGSVKNIQIDSDGNYIYVSGIKIDGRLLVKPTGTITNNFPSINSVVRANPSAGFSIITADSLTANTEYSIGHSLNSTPHFIIGKNKAQASQWDTYHVDVGAGQLLRLNGTGAATAATQGTDSNFSTAPTDSVFYFKANGVTNDYVFYCFAPVEGYSKFGSYAGTNAAVGPYIYTGFRPAFVMIKNISLTSAYTSWYMIDSERATYNPTDYLKALWANQQYIEGKRGNGDPSGTFIAIDMLSNGFSIPNTGGGNHELCQNSYTYIYLAFAEHPFKNARAR